MFNIEYTATLTPKQKTRQAAHFSDIYSRPNQRIIEFRAHASYLLSGVINV